MSIVHSRALPTNRLYLVKINIEQYGLLVYISNQS
nr:MAG TPA: hypothetical protein [Caudoviricetes sp.]